MQRRDNWAWGSRSTAGVSRSNAQASKPGRFFCFTACIFPPMRRHYALSGLVIATAIVAGTAVLRSDAIVITRAMLASTVSEVFIERDSIVVELEIGAADLPSFRNLLPDGAYEAMGYEPTPWAERLDRFFTEDFVISEDGRHPLPGRLLDLTTRERIKRDEVTGEPIPLAEDEEPEPVVFARLRYDLPPTPPALVFQPPGPDGTGIANIGFVAYHRGIHVNDFRYLGRRERVQLDWEDPWFSQFENRNLRRQFFAPISTFLYIEHNEVRSEVVLRPKDLRPWIDLGLEGSDTIRVEDQQALKARVVEFLSTVNPVTINGVPAEGFLDRVHFIYRNLRTSGVIEPARDLDVIQATLGVIFVYPVDSLPEEVTVTWELFNDRIPVVPSSSSDEAGSLPYLLSEGDNVLRWTNFLTNPKGAGMVEVSAPPSGRVWFILIALGAVTVLAMTIRRHWLALRHPLTLPLRPAIVLIATTVVAIIAIPRAVRTGISDAQAQEVLGGLLRNVYRAFDYREEDRIYDTLERSAAGNLLTDIYLETRRSLELANQGGARARVKEIDILDGDYSPLTGRRGFVGTLRWNVMGSVGHWGHIHQRTNQYEARLTVEVVDEQWKITGLELLEEKRI